MGLIRNICSFGFTVSVLLSISALSDASVLRKRDSNCSPGPGWAFVDAIGDTRDGDGYTDSCETSYGNDYTPVSGIEVWTKGTGDHIAGMSTYPIMLHKFK